MLDVRRMQVLRAVVTSGSVTAAAANLGYTPSAISQQVAALEKQAGMALLERAGRGVRPTAAGRLLTEHAGIISQHVAEAETGPRRPARRPHRTAGDPVLRHGRLRADARPRWRGSAASIRACRWI